MNIDAATVGVLFGAVNTVVMIGGGFFFMGRLTGRLDIQDVKIARIESDVHETKGLLVSAAVDASRLNRAEADIQNLDTDVRLLRRGVGFIKDADATSVNREY